MGSQVRSGSFPVSVSLWLSRPESMVLSVCDEQLRRRMALQRSNRDLGGRITMLTGLSAELVTQHKSET